jgi:hypothetical protein
MRGCQRHALGQQAVLHREDPGALGVAGLGVVEVVLDVVGDVVVHASGIHLAAMVRAAAAEGERSEGKGRTVKASSLVLVMSISLTVSMAAPVKRSAGWM